MAGDPIKAWIGAAIQSPVLPVSGLLCPVSTCYLSVRSGSTAHRADLMLELAVP
ncbi:MAG TPA: hypothetical protein VN455_03695 [Methanotrichaceae archaeon]|nr:hypothetical protein [Methanotrichaceae archaeon]